MKKLPFLFLLFITTLAAHAQGKLTGVVLDSASRQPLAFASVFLANTTLGATTTEQGEFVFPKVPAGTYDLVGSYVGYNLSKQNITVGKAAAPQSITLTLSASGPTLGEVVVHASPHSQEDYDKFSGLFLGQTAFSQQCRITNPKNVVVFVNDSTQELVASAKNFVEVENDALGYRLKYYGMSFRFSPDGRAGSFDGQPVFEEMTPQDDQQRQQWAANRAKAYAGSFTHFLRSVYTNTLKAQGFLAQRVRLQPNPAYARAEAQRQALLGQRPNGPYSAAQQDSLDEWAGVQPAFAVVYPGVRPIDSIRHVSADRRHTYLRFTGDLQVAYFGETPDPAYGQPMSPLGYSRTPYPAEREVSKVRLLARQVEILPNGSLHDSEAVALGEYWGFEKIGEFMPLDYEPPATLAPPPAAPPRAQPAGGRAQLR